MRHFLILLFFLPTVAWADPYQGLSLCPVVRRESLNRITCSQLGDIYQLEFHNKTTYRIVKWSGRHQDMIDTLCLNASVIIESIKGVVERRLHCPEEKE